MNIFRKCIDLHYVLYIAYLYLKYLFDVFDNCRLEKKYEVYNRYGCVNLLQLTKCFQKFTRSARAGALERQYFVV